MIGSDLEGAVLESRVASWAASKTQPARLRQLFALERTGAIGRSPSTCTSRRSSQEGAAPASCESAIRIRARPASACGR